MIATIHPVSPEEVMALADGELSGAETSAVAAHMAECAECASVAAQLRDTSESLSRWTVPAAPSSMDEVISSAAAQVAGNAPSSAPVKTGRHPGRRQWKWNSWDIGPRGAVAPIVVLLASGSAIQPGENRGLDGTAHRRLHEPTSVPAAAGTQRVVRLRSSAERPAGCACAGPCRRQPGRTRQPRSNVKSAGSQNGRWCASTRSRARASIRPPDRTNDRPLRLAHRAGP
jgi:hypothetical protein